MARRAANRRIIYKAAGYDDEDIKYKPHIGIANTYFEGSPGTGHLRKLAESVKQGIWMNGGMPLNLVCLLHVETLRQVQTDCVMNLRRGCCCNGHRNVVQVHKFDGLVILASCDNIIAGAYLAALRVGIPTIVVTGGPMYVGSFNGRKVVQAEIDVAALKGDEEFLNLVEDYACPSFGACPSMGTANTMQILGEALNLVIPGTATIPAGDNLKLRKCVEAGRFID